jgi:hypothetical protein
MAKVIVERPRIKAWAWDRPRGYQKRLRRQTDDGPPSREGMTARWQGGQKIFNEHLGPLRRYLDAQVGRPWDKVFSEICAHIRRDSVVQNHVRTHVEGYVTTHVLLIDGVPCCGEGGWHYGEPLHRLRGRPWYVCPRTGLLRRVKPPKRQPRARPKPKPPRYIRVSDTLQCRLIDGAWHLVTLKPLPAPYFHRAKCRDVDVLQHQPVAQITNGEAQRRYGSASYAVAMRRLARRELQHYPIPSEFWQ